jgi:hypothetical protein
MSKETMFWWIRRRLGVRDFDIAPEVDAAIRETIELYPLEMTIDILRRRLQMNEGNSE